MGTITSLSNARRRRQGLAPIPERECEALRGFVAWKRLNWELMKTGKSLTGPVGDDLKLKVVWLLWPILHGLLWLQTESDDYEEKAAEIYGVLSMAMESPRAVSVLGSIFTQLLPLPRN